MSCDIDFCCFRSTSDDVGTLELDHPKVAMHSSFSHGIGTFHWRFLRQLLLQLSVV